MFRVEAAMEEFPEMCSDIDERPQNNSCRVWAQLKALHSSGGVAVRGVTNSSTYLPDAADEAMGAEGTPSLSCSLFKVDNLCLDSVHPP